MPLTFDDLTDVGLAVVRGRIHAPRALFSLTPGDLAPFVELSFRLADWALQIEAMPLLAGSRIGKCLAQSQSSKDPAFDVSDEDAIGFLRLDANSGKLPDLPFTKLGIEAKRSAVAVGIPDGTAASLVGSIRELRDNILEHSGRPQSGVLAFRATRDRFDFCVADAGQGVFSSLTANPKYRHLTDSGEALRVALTDGESRLGPGSDRGFGFHDLFVTMQKMPGFLHFKSGSHRLEHLGQSPTVRKLDLAECAPFRGFLVAASCFPGPDNNR